ncbi:hypothetical protein RKE30_01510 [Streptomyces sp. Li-HN-5-11]|uniref:hypothetical protein n=1 Tax=Streptomyces sp. Li-HN-5-11 TaxID=3075432 RepID=UPI0028A62ADF|nr:hypothetical protein [Streptomyces sp. Li-HN-5-11]WNM29171.1 hypothetical protein RKE30_01510 [Streptomyces sp. Li-HN-5-11]
MTTPAPDDSGASAPFNALPSPLEAVPDLRAAARWMLAAFGAVGAALIGGGPLVAVGRVHGVADAFGAGVALVVALTGVSIAIWHVSRVLEPPITTPATLATPALRGLREMIDSAPAHYFGTAATSVDDLLSHRAVAVNIHRAMLSETDPSRREVWRRHLERARVNVARVAPLERWLLAMAHVYQIQAALRAARYWCLVGVALVAAGAVGFLIITGNG